MVLIIGSVITVAVAAAMTVLLWPPALRPSRTREVMLADFLRTRYDLELLAAEVKRELHAIDRHHS